MPKRRKRNKNQVPFPHDTIPQLQPNSERKVHDLLAVIDRAADITRRNTDA